MELYTKGALCALLLAFAAPGLGGCADAQPGAALAADPVSGVTYTPAKVSAYSGAATREEVEQALSHTDAALAFAVQTIEEAPDADAADRAFRADLEAQADPLARRIRAQHAAHAMLTTHLLGRARTPQRDEATAFYTALLVDHQSPDAALVERALQHLGDAPPAWRSAVATKAAQNAEARVQAATDCAGCDTDRLLSALSVRAPNQRVELEGMLEAAARLREVR